MKPAAVTLLLALSTAFACGSNESHEPAEPQTVSAPERQGASPVPESWVEERTGEAERRLGASPAGQLLWQSIEAHGGLTAWLTAGTIEFEFDYAPVAAPAGRKHTFQRVDLWSARAHHQEVDRTATGAAPGDLAEFGFDGESSWMKPNTAAFSPSARFWALTPYYFVGMPFVLADPGVIVEQLEDAELDGETHQLIKASYESGTGDSPDDYYILYLHPETHRLAALRYVVSFPGMFAPGEHSPEKLMRYTEFADVDGLSLAGRYDTFTFDLETALPGDKVTEVRANRIRLGQTYPDSIFAAPEGAAVEPAP